MTPEQIEDREHMNRLIAAIERLTEVIERTHAEWLDQILPDQLK